MFRGIDYENLKEGDLIQFYGVHVLRWEDEIRPYGIEPRIAFVEDDTLEKENAKLKKALENIRDLARTGIAPDSFMLDKSGWDQHRIGTIAREANEALATTEKE